MPENPSNPAPTPGATPAKRPRSTQDKIIEAYIADSKKFLNVASTDAEIRPILAAHGYDPAEFALGTQLAETSGTARTRGGSQPQFNSIN